VQAARLKMIPLSFLIGVIRVQVLAVQALVLQELDLFFRLLNSLLRVAQSFNFL
jgi:hypothetical protein